MSAEEFTREYEMLYQSLFLDCIGSSEQTASLMSFYDILDAVAEFKDKIITHLADPR